jgi:hypothetical protein
MDELSTTSWLIEPPGPASAGHQFLLCFIAKIAWFDAAMLDQVG